MKIYKLINAAFIDLCGDGFARASTDINIHSRKIANFTLQIDRRIHENDYQSTKENKLPNFWFAFGKEVTFFMLQQKNYTKTDPGIRHYSQSIISWADTNEIENVNPGDFFTSAKFFQEFRYEDNRNQKGFIPLSDSMDIEHQKVPISKTLVDKLLTTVTKNKKLVVEINTEGLELDGNGAMDFMPFKKLFYALGELPVETRKQIGISTMERYENFKVRVDVGSKPIVIPREEGYYLFKNYKKLPKGSVIGFLASLIGEATYQDAKPERNSTETIYQEMTLQEFGAPETKILIHYGEIPEYSIQGFEEDGFEIVGEDIFL